MTASTARTNVLPFIHPRAREAYHRGLAMGRALAEQAPNRVRWTVTVLTRDALMLGLAAGLLLGVIADHLVRQ